MQLPACVLWRMPPPIDETLIQAGLLKELCPAPLGNGRDNFLKFIKDVKQYGPEYLEGSVASLSMQAMGDSGEDSIWSLVASIKNTPTNKETSKATQNLWRARFMLKMEEIHAREERELLQALHNAAAKKKEILHSLKDGDEVSDLEESGQNMNGESSNEKTMPPLATAFTSQRLIQEEQSMSAWTELFRRHTVENHPLIATTAYTDAAALLIDTCDADKKPVSLGSLLLPSFQHLYDEDYISQRDGLQTKLKKCRSNIFKILQEAACLQVTDGSQQLQTLFEKEGEAWEDILVNSGMPPQTTPEKIDFFLFPGASLQDLFNHFTKTKHENIKEDQPAQNSILAVLTQ